MKGSAYAYDSAVNIAIAPTNPNRIYVASYQDAYVIGLKADTAKQVAKSNRLDPSLYLRTGRISCKSLTTNRTFAGEQPENVISPRGFLRQFRCCRFCSGQSTSDQQGSTGDMMQVVNDSTESSYFL